MLVERPETPWTQHELSIELAADVHGEIRVFDDVQFSRLDEVAVNVDDLDALAAHRHFAAPCGAGLERAGFRAEEIAARREKSGRRARHRLEEASAIWHGWCLRDAGYHSRAQS